MKESIPELQERIGEEKPSVQAEGAVTVGPGGLFFFGRTLLHLAGAKGSGAPPDGAR